MRVLRVPETQLRSLDYEPFEFSNEARQISESNEWNELIQFALRKAERFMKSNVIELQIPDEITEGGRYSPRFIDEISDELDVIEDKKAPLLCESIDEGHVDVTMTVHFSSSFQSSTKSRRCSFQCSSF